MGRSRKALARRKPSGRIVQDEIENRHGPATVKRMLDYIAANVRQPEYGTVLGLMVVQKKISPEEFNAGCKFATLRARADRALGIPARNPVALRYEGSRGISCAPDDPERDIAAVEALEKVETAFSAASREFSAVEDVCVYDRLLDTHEDRLSFQAGISRLAVHMGLKKA